MIRLQLIKHYCSENLRNKQISKNNHKQLKRAKDRNNEEETFMTITSMNTFKALER